MQNYSFFLILLLFALFISGCTECRKDSCSYDREKIAIWSEDDSKLALIVDDLGEKDSRSDNHSYLYTFNPDGTELNKVIEVESAEFLQFLNIRNDYAIIGRSTRYELAPNYAKMVKLSTGEVSVIAGAAPQPCEEYKVLPSLTGDHLAIIKNSGLVSSYIGETTSSGSVSVTPVGAGPLKNSANNPYCPSMKLNIEFIDVATGAVVGAAESDSPGFYYFVFTGNQLDTWFTAIWNDTGLIIPDFDTENLSSDYAHVAIDGTVSNYSKPDNCGQQETSSGALSSDGSEARVVAFDGGQEAFVSIMIDQGEANVICGL